MIFSHIGAADPPTALLMSAYGWWNRAHRDPHRIKDCVGEIPCWERIKAEIVAANATIARAFECFVKPAMNLAKHWITRASYFPPREGVALCRGPSSISITQVARLKSRRAERLG